MSALDAHLGDDEIDDYVRRRLSDERQRVLEEHYLGCPECLARVERVEALSSALREMPERRSSGGIRWLKVAAVVLAAVAGGFGLATYRLSQRGAEDAGRVQPPSRSLPAESSRTAEPWPRIELAPPLRGEALATVVLAGGATNVLVTVDAREAAAPGTTYDVRVVDPADSVLARFPALASSPDGLVTFPLPARLLSSGLHRVDLQGPDVLLQIPFRVERTTKP